MDPFLLILNFTTNHMTFYPDLPTFSNSSYHPGCQDPVEILTLIEGVLNGNWCGMAVVILPSSAKPQFSSTGLRLALILIYPASAQPPAHRD